MKRSKKKTIIGVLVVVLTIIKVLIIILIILIILIISIRIINKLPKKVGGYQVSSYNYSFKILGDIQIIDCNNYTCIDNSTMVIDNYEDYISYKESIKGIIKVKNYDTDYFNNSKLVMFTISARDILNITTNNNSINIILEDITNSVDVYMNLYVVEVPNNIKFFSVTIKKEDDK